VLEGVDKERSDVRKVEQIEWDKREVVVADAWSWTGIMAMSGFAVDEEAVAVRKEERALVALGGYLTLPLCSGLIVTRWLASQQGVHFVYSEVIIATR
jgi:hypothetical protein